MTSKKHTDDKHSNDTHAYRLKHVTPERQSHLDSFLEEFNYTPQYLKELTKYVQDQIHSSYVHHAKDPYGPHDPAVSDFRSLDTCVQQTPSGAETGVYYGIDVGGTNMRVVRCAMLGKGDSTIDADKYDIREQDVGLPKGLLDKNCTASMLFDFIADGCKKLIQKHGDDKQWVSIGFTFSFAVQMVLIDRAIVMSLSKGFETGSKTIDPLHGQDCVAMMNHAFKRKGVKAVIAGCLNDTTGTLLTAAYESGKHPELPPVRVGLIIGTGFNTCVTDEKALSYGYQGSLINLESGGLVTRDHLVDLMMDCESSNRKEQNAEKKISGAYLGEVVRHSCLYVLESEAVPLMYRKNSLTTYHTAQIFNAYGTNEAVTVVDRVMKEAFNWTVPSPEHSAIIAEIVYAVWDRSAAIVAAIMAGCAEQTERLRRSMGGLTVGVDGSVYCLNPRYQKRIRSHLETILGDRSALLHIVETADGSGKGAAMLACANPVNFEDM